MFVEELNRYGFSGAKLYRIWSGPRKLNLPYIAKVSNSTDIRAEWRGIKSTQNLFSDARPTLAPVFFGGRGIIVYPDFGTRELEDIVFDLSFNQKRLLSLIDHCYDHFQNPRARSIRARKKVNVYEQFADHFDVTDARPLGEAIFERFDTDKREFLGYTILNPLALLRKLKEATICLGAIHGDLHPKNIMLDDKELMTPHLIDYRWSCTQGPVLLDYVLLELSLRHFLLPSRLSISPEEHGAVDQLLLSEKVSKASFDQIKIGASRRPVYRRLISLIGKIRERARKAVGDEYEFSEYLLVLFLKHYGLLKYPGYNNYLSVRAIGMLSDHLNSLYQNGELH